MRKEDFLYKPKRKKTAGLVLLAALALVATAYAVFQIPAVHDRYGVRVEYTLIYLNSIFNPVQAMPTPIQQAVLPVGTPTPAASLTPTLAQPIATVTPTPILSPTPTLSPTPLPGQASLPSPKNEKEDWNNCGPATLAMHLRMFGWKGDQFTISNVIKPIRDDRNVNVEELIYYIRTQEGWIGAEYRVGGTLDTLRSLLAAGLPVTIEGSFKLVKDFWVGDDRWAGHYVLLTGYDDVKRLFTTQDSETGADQMVSYDQLEKNWVSFNHVYLVLYKPEQLPTLQSVLGADWNAEVNRQNALTLAQAEANADPQNAFAWFNIGTNLTYFDRYGEAVTAYDKARAIGLPQRMLRYQFGPFMAYFNTGRYPDLMSLTEYALKITPSSEEAMLWRGWGLYRTGDLQGAIDLFKKALEAHPGYTDAEYALKFVGG